MIKEKWEQALHDPGDLRREMQEGHGGRLVNMLVGLIINSNDAYERSGHTGKRVIEVDVNRTKNKQVGGRLGKVRIRVIDWSHGMDYEDFGRNFSAYGGAKSRWIPGINISGLFGREASDIMWSNVGSRYLSIKDGKGYACEFRPPVEFRRYELDRRVTKQFQHEFHVGKRNFTLAEFYLDQDYPLPSHDNIVSGLKNHFRLRLINSKPSVEILFQYTDSRGTRKPQRIKFLPLETEGEAELLSEETFQLKYKHYPPFTAEGRLFRKRDRNLTQSGLDREGGVLVYSDDDTVMELSLFNFDDGTYAPYIGHFFGYLKLNVAAILRQELREADHRVALIEVDRSQLKRRTGFYEILKAQIETWLKPWIDAERERIAQTRASDATGNWNRRLRPLFAEINRVINLKTGQSGAQIKASAGTPPEVMGFTRSKVTTSAGTIYRIDLQINTTVVPPGTRLILYSDNPSITVQPPQEVVPEPNHQKFTDVARIVVRLSAEREGETAIVTAEIPNQAKATLEIESIEPDVYFPHNGIEWWPDTFEAVSGRVSHPTLWIDLARITNGDSIYISTASSLVEVLEGNVLPTAVRVLKEDTIAGIKIGRARPRFRANGRRGQGALEARWRDISDSLKFRIVDPRETAVPGNWTFSGIEFEDGPEDLDVYPNPEGKICLFA